MKILCFGDCCTWGLKEIGVRYDNKTRWTALLSDMLDKDGYTIIEGGLCGRMAYSLEEDKDRQYGFLQKAIRASYPFDVLIFSLGLSDLRSELKFEAQEIAENVEKLLQTILHMDYSGGNIPKIILASPTHIKHGVTTAPNSNMYNFREDAVEKSKEFAALYKDVADRLGIHFFDMALYAQAGDLDCWNIDADGHRAIANAMCEYIKNNTF